MDKFEWNNNTPYGCLGSLHDCWVLPNRAKCALIKRRTSLNFYENYCIFQNDGTRFFPPPSTANPLCGWLSQVLRGIVIVCMFLQHFPRLKNKQDSISSSDTCHCEKQSTAYWHYGPSNVQTIIQASEVTSCTRTRKPLSTKPLGGKYHSFPYRIECPWMNIIIINNVDSSRSRCWCSKVDTCTRKEAKDRVQRSMIQLPYRPKSAANTARYQLATGNEARIGAAVPLLLFMKFSS
jgi:hypothetical protein